MNNLQITPTSTTSHTFSYDNWNLIHERVETYNPTTETWTPNRSLEYFWGPDLSGSLQGAGGIGGLLAVSMDNTFYFPCTDNLGNITAYVSESGNTVATDSYDAFGNTLASSGTHSTIFPHRFSSKYFDSETDLYYNERYMESDWSPNDYCMTFTFSALVGGAKLVLEDPSSTSLEKEQATFLLMLALRATTAETPNEVVEFLSITSLSTSWITRYEVPKDMHD